jgi:hypothetical protein
MIHAGGGPLGARPKSNGWVVTGTATGRSMTGANWGSCVFWCVRGVAGGVVYPCSMVCEWRGCLVVARQLKYAHYGAFTTVTAWTLDGWTPAAWAMAWIRKVSCWSCSCVRETTALPVVVKKYVHLYPRLHLQ